MLSAVGVGVVVVVVGVIVGVADVAAAVVFRLKKRGGVQRLFSKEVLVGVCTSDGEAEGPCVLRGGAEVTRSQSATPLINTRRPAYLVIYFTSTKPCSFPTKNQLEQTHSAIS